MPLPAVWGPLAWSLLHSIGNRAGQNVTKKLQVDENREALWLLHHLEYIIPCPECRQHIKVYRKKHGLPRTSAEFGIWIWKFHEAVNQRLGKPPGPPFSSEIGGGIWQQWLSYTECVQESFQVGHLYLIEVKEWKRHLHHWVACF
jgi:hypothetical protein